MPVSGPTPGNPSPLSESARPTAAFFLPPDMFELIYGNECRDAIGTQAALIAPHPVGPAELSALAGAEAVFTGWSSPCFDEMVLRQLPRLRAVFHGAGSVRPYVTEAFWRRNITITTGSDLTINSAGKGLVGWVNQNGSIVITNYATINAGQDDSFTNHSSEAGTEGIDGSAHGEGSNVSITNYGAITSTYGRGIYADGGYASSTAANAVWSASSGLMSLKTIPGLG